MRLRTAVAAVALSLPLIGLILLIVEPRLDVAWQHDPAHFWLVLVAAALSVALAYATGTAARRRSDARVFLVSLAFLAAAGFLGLHALATPGVLLSGPNAGFTLATPVGLLVAAVFAAASSADLTSGRARWVMARSSLLRYLLIAVLLVWGVASLAEVPPLDAGAPPERASGSLVVLPVAGLALYAAAVVRYARLPRHPASTALVTTMTAAFVLLAEAEIAIAVGRNWHLTWWLWHVLMLTAFAMVAVAAHRQWHEERFAGLYLPQTAQDTREITVLFADLQGFTAFSERHAPQEVTAMLNEYFTGAVPPVVERHGGQVDRIVGDALMATFNTYGDQPDHAARAARSALAIQRVTGEVAERHPDWPRFRIGINTGASAVGLLGTAGGRTYTAIGDTVNLAARLESAAPVGQVLIGSETARRLPGARLETLGQILVKGKAESVEAFLLIDV